MSLLSLQSSVQSAPSRHARIVRHSLALAIAVALGVAASAVAAQASDAVGARVATQEVPAVVGRAQYLRPHAASAAMNVLVSLKLRNAAQLDAFLRDVRDPASAQYHKFLTPQQFAAQYGPTQQQVQQVVAYLRAQGLRVQSVSRNNMLVRASGTVAVAALVANSTPWRSASVDCQPASTPASRVLSPPASGACQTRFAWTIRFRRSVPLV